MPRVLIVEDHDIGQELIAAMVRHAGAEPAVAGTGADALDQVAGAVAAARPFALVLMDMHLPDMTGLEVTRRLRQAHSAATLPIVALTASDAAADVQACLDAGMQAHLAKPVRAAQVGALVAALGGGSGRSAVVTASPSLRERYRARKAAAIEAVEALLDGPDTPAGRARALDLLHKLAGTGAMFGEEAVGERAHAFERELLHRLDNGERELVRRELDAMRDPPGEERKR